MEMMDWAPAPGTCDIIFSLPDGDTVHAHQRVLAIASPVFEAEFGCSEASDLRTVEVRDVDSTAFRRLVDFINKFIYKSGTLDCSSMDSSDYWSLLHVAHLFLVPVLIEFCIDKLSEIYKTRVGLMAKVKRASQVFVKETSQEIVLALAGLEEVAIKRNLQKFNAEVLIILRENEVLDLAEVMDQKLKLSGDDHTEVTFSLPDGGTVTSNKLVLANASPVFNMQFYGSLASDNNKRTVEVRDVDSTAFRRLVDFINNSMDWDTLDNCKLNSMDSMDTMEYWKLNYVAHMFLVPALIDHCNLQLSDIYRDVARAGVMAQINISSQVFIKETAREIALAGLDGAAIRDKLETFMTSESWIALQDSVMTDLAETMDQKMKLSEMC